MNVNTPIQILSAHESPICDAIKESIIIIELTCKFDI
jgi:hypothetical protein